MSTRTFPFRRFTLFVVLSFADLFLTWRLLHRGGDMCESNPVARWWLYSFGWAGLVGFKLGIVALVAGLVAVTARFRPRAAGRVLTFGCAALLAVVAYSCYLHRHSQTTAGAAPPPDLAAATAQRERLDERIDGYGRYWAELTRLSEELGARRCTLAQATERWANCDVSRDPVRLRRLHSRFPGRTDAECLSIKVLEVTLSDWKNDPAARELAERLEAEFRTCYGRPSPFAG